MESKSPSRLRRILLRGILIVLLVGVVGILALSLSIELGVKEMCGTAARAYPGDKVEALMKFVKSDEHTYDAHRYRANNRAFWALGQLGDKRALPFLRDLLTGQPCDHETNLCQGEIQEAIQKLESNGFNLPKVLWRGVLNY
jgi:PBS lyase HEAT-like repeat